MAAGGAVSQSEQATTGGDYVASGLLLATLLVLLGAIAHQLACTLSIISPATLPGDNPPGTAVAVLSGLVAMVAGAVLVNLLALSTMRAQALLALVGPASAALVSARFYTFDPYYLPTLRRFADGGAFSEEWVFGLLGAALFAGLTSWRWPVLGARLTGIILAVSAFTLVFIGAGH